MDRENFVLDSKSPFDRRTASKFTLEPGSVPPASPPATMVEKIEEEIMEKRLMQEQEGDKQPEDYVMVNLETETKQE
eukprot:m.21715 g.21715  ORF g.21715 m.21715 type:complete len:77 (+) comp12762_c0_seq1:1404-1634(+)